MSDEYRKMDSQYNNYDEEHANGFLFILFIWLVAGNSVGAALYSFPMISFYYTYLPMIGHNWIQIPAIIANICTVIFILFSFILGIGIYRLKYTAWKLLKWYFPVVQLFFLIITIPAFFILPLLNNVEIFPYDPELKIKTLSADFSFRIIVSTAISLLCFIYCIKSKKAPKQFPALKK